MRSIHSPSLIGIYIIHNLSYYIIIHQLFDFVTCTVIIVHIGVIMKKKKKKSLFICGYLCVYDNFFYFKDCKYLAVFFYF